MSDRRFVLRCLGTFTSLVVVLGVVSVLSTVAAVASDPLEGAEPVSAASVTEPTLLPWLSTESSDTYLLPNGSLQTKTYLETINYQDAAGDWHPVDNDLVAAPGAA